MTAVDRIFGFYGVIWDFFTLPEVTAILDEHAAEQEAAELAEECEAAPDTDPDAEPYVDWAALLQKITNVLAPLGHPLHVMNDAIMSDLTEWERWRWRRPVPEVA